MVNDVKPGGVFLINCQWNMDELNHHMPAEAKRYIAKNNIQLYTVNAIDIAAEIVGVESDDEGNRVVTVQLTENGAYAGKIELTAASADSENSMRITACKSYRAK